MYFCVMLDDDLCDYFVMRENRFDDVSEAEISLARENAIKIARELKTEMPESVVVVEAHNDQKEVILKITIHDPEGEPDEIDFREITLDLPRFLAWDAPLTLGESLDSTESFGMAYPFNQTKDDEQY